MAGQIKIKRTIVTSEERSRINWGAHAGTVGAVEDARTAARDAATAATVGMGTARAARAEDFIRAARACADVVRASRAAQAGAERSADVLATLTTDNVFTMGSNEERTRLLCVIAHCARVNADAVAHAGRAATLAGEAAGILYLLGTGADYVRGTVD